MEEFYESCPFFYFHILEIPGIIQVSKSSDSLMPYTKGKPPGE